MSYVIKKIMTFELGYLSIILPNHYDQLIILIKLFSVFNEHIFE